MFEKLPTARMNNRERSSTERLIADTRERRDKETSHEASRRFPSYLRVFVNFFGPLISESHQGATRLLSGCYGRFPTAQAHVAFL
jgi:hypothetical protein